MDFLQIVDEITLRSFTPDDALAFFALLQANRHHLDSWLRWSGRITTIEATQQLIARFAKGDGFHVGIWVADELIGGVVCHYINRESNKSEIGYWLAQDAVGRGIVTRCCQAVLKYLFEIENMHRIEIQCAVDNVRSRAVAERLGFTLEGIKRESEWLTTRYADHALYALLVHEFRP